MPKVWLAGGDVSGLGDIEQSFTGLQARIAAVPAFVAGLDTALLVDAATREIITHAGKPMGKRFTGQS